MKRFLILISVALFAFVACNQNEEIPPVAPQVDLKDTPITVSAAVEGMLTRAGYDNTNLPETFYLSMDQTGENYDYPNMLMTKGTGNTYTPETPMLWAGDAEDNYVLVKAATSSFDGSRALTAQADQSTADAVKASDHLYMSAKPVTPSADGISVDFAHIMSKVILTITLGDEFDSESNPITGVTFQGTVASNDYIPENGWQAFADDATATDIIPLCNGYTPIGGSVTNATAEYEVILVPQTVAEGNFTVQFNVGDREFKWTSEDAVTLESGYKYTLGLTAGKDKVELGDITAAPWGQPENGGDLETE